MGNSLSVQEPQPDMEERVARAVHKRKLLQFPWEVILCSMEHLTSPADVSRCMRVSRYIFTRAHDVLLRRHPVHLTQHTLSSFCLFMKRDYTRAKSLRELSVDLAVIENWETQVLIRSMRVAKGRVRRLGVTAESFLVDYRVGIALGELTGVQEVEALGWNDHMHSFLFNLHCPVRKATICFDEPGDGARKKPKVDLLHSLSRFHNTLEELTADFVTWDFDIETRFAPRFEKLWMLHLKDHNIRDIEVLEGALPNLLVLKDTNQLGGRMRGNVSGTTNLNMKRKPWPVLDLVHIRLGNPLALRIASAVDTLRVDIPEDPEDRYDRDGAYAEVLRLLKPQQLVVCFDDPNTSAEFVERILARTPINVKTLAVVTSTRSSFLAGRRDDWISHLDAIRNALNKLTYYNSITRLILKTHILPPPPPPRFMKPSDYTRKAVQARELAQLKKLPKLSSPYMPTSEERKELRAIAAEKLLRLESVTVVLETGPGVQCVDVVFRVRRHVVSGVALVPVEDPPQCELLGL